MIDDEPRREAEEQPAGARLAEQIHAKYAALGCPSGPVPDRLHPSGTAGDSIADLLRRARGGARRQRRLPEAESTFRQALLMPADRPANLRPWLRWPGCYEPAARPPKPNTARV